MDGLLIIDKPAGLTSHDVVARVRRILRTKRVGHTGTLDPFATGVLVLCIGKATRLSQFLVGCDKTYEAVVRLGFATDTQDATGKPITPTCASDELPISSLQQVLAEFMGKQEQTPPMYSAKKVAGVALHKLARQGTEVERRPVAIEIFELSLGAVGEPNESPAGTRDFALRVRCTAGTYIRTLAHDLGARLGCGAHLTTLRRVAVNGFTLAAAWSLEQLAEVAGTTEVAQILVPMTKALPDLAVAAVSAREANRLITGQAVPYERAELLDEQAVQVVLGGEKLIGIARYRRSERELIPWVILADRGDIEVQ